MQRPYKKLKIIKSQGSSREVTDDYVAVEKKLCISLNEQHIISLLCTPFMIEELVNGFLLNEGILTQSISPDEMKIVYGGEISVDINIQNKDISGIAALRCLGGITLNKTKVYEKIKDTFLISIRAIQNMFEEFQQKSELFRLTGCFHSAALSDGKGILVFAEDIGRHNTIDKIIGYSILNNISFDNKLILVSCRISSDIVSKCSRWKIPVLASRAAPTDLAVEIAKKIGVTLIGFVRGPRLNIYTNEQRIQSLKL